MDDLRTLDRTPYYASYYEHLDRVLNRPQLAGIGISGCVGAGIFVTSGSLIAVSGSLGGVLSYIIAGGFVACVLYTLTEMVACRPLTGSLVDLPHTFLDPAFGFAVATSYALANVCSMATLTAQSAELTALLKDDQKPHKVSTEIGINILFIGLTTISHCLGVKLYGKIERVIMWFKLSLFVVCCVLMLVINVGGGGPRKGAYNQDYTTYGFSPGWKPMGFNSTTKTFLKSTNVPDSHFGIGGSGGQLFAFLTTVSIAMFSCMGGDMVAMTAGEAKNPWQDVPVAMSAVYLVPLSLYPLILLSAGANVNYADPNLAKLWSRGNGKIPLSPFVIAAQNTSLHGLPKALNLFFVISAYTAANTATYISSRTVFILAQQYLSPRLANIFGRTNNGHTPLAAIGLCSALGLLSLVGLSQYAYSQPRITLSQFFTGSVSCVYICLCFTFLKFKKGLDRLAQRRILSRNDSLYISRLFKSRWQPLPAYIGLVGCAFVVLWSGVPPLYILILRGSLTSSNDLKSTVALAFDVIGVYIGPVLFLTFYLSYKYIHPRSFSVDIRDLTPGHYVLDDLSTLEQDNPSTPRKSSDGNTAFDHTMIAQLDSPCEPRFPLRDLSARNSKATAIDRVQSAVEISPEMQDEIEAQRARREERERVKEILERRPRRMQRGIWRELWSFVITDKDK